MHKFLVTVTLMAWSGFLGAQPLLPTGPGSQSAAPNGGNKVKRGGMCAAAVMKNADTKQQDGGWSYTKAQFNCDHLGAVTVAQIYDRGWRVVSVVRNQPPHAQSDIVFGPALLVIEEQ